MQFNHFSALVLCAALIAVAFGWLSRSTTKERVTSALRYFVLFVIIAVALGWLMYPFSR